MPIAFFPAFLLELPLPCLDGGTPTLQEWRQGRAFAESFQRFVHGEAWTVVMALYLGEFADLGNEAQRLAEVAELQFALNPMRVVPEFPRGILA